MEEIQQVEKEGENRPEKGHKISQASGSRIHHGQLGMEAIY
jgi:hypothetical protein